MDQRAARPPQRPRAVARCPGCSDAVVRYVRAATSAQLDRRGTVRLVVALEPNG